MSGAKVKALAVDCIFEGGRMFVGAVSVAYLLNLEYPPSTVALLKLVQSAIVLLGEFPSGVISDYFGRKLCLLASVISAILGFICYMHAGHLGILIVGEAFLALSLCLWSGSYEAWALDISGVKNESIKEFFHTNGSLNQFAVLVTGLLGGLLSGQGGLYLYAYIASLCSMIFLLLFLLSAPNGTQHHPEKKPTQVNSVFSALVSDAKTSISVVASTRALIGALVLMAAMQFSVQPMIHYWQPLVSSVFGENGMIFGFFFAVFCAGSSIVSWVFRKSQFDNAIGLFVLWTVLLVLIGLNQSKVYVSVTLVAAQVSYFFLRSIISGHVAAHAPAAHRASIFSFTSLVSKAGMFVSLFVIAAILELSEANGSGVRLLYILVPSVSCLCLLLGLIVNRRMAKLGAVEALE